MTVTVGSTVEGGAVQDLMLIELEAPIERWDDPEVRRHLGEIIALKRDGYRQYYDFPVAPVDTLDYVSTHLLTCRRSSGELLMAWRVTTCAQTERYGLSFPPDTYAAQWPQLGQHLGRARERAAESGGTLAYCSRWTARPSLRRDRRLFVHLGELASAQHAAIREHQRIAESFMSAVRRLHLEGLYARNGFEPLRLGDVDMEVRVPHLRGETCLLMHCQETSAWSRQVALRWEELWTKRCVL
ncbi:hypothetical protein HNR42_000960 [Deinobacterium chartae]|uniref:Uncharacterized protein n=1 Tax=Deinobacterium chartae TaxID=521158 RepID=A0A841HXG1_9DEIO|nr:hypothetical protein [Deinobacterium chartae]MBB6097543.1 hypothetical protein [Deinobacterium chartae]